jgi:hypothetical protein
MQRVLIRIHLCSQLRRTSRLPGHPVRQTQPRGHVQELRGSEAHDELPQNSARFVLHRRKPKYQR